MLWYIERLSLKNTKYFFTRIKLIEEIIIKCVLRLNRKIKRYRENERIKDELGRGKEDRVKECFRK